MPPGRPRSSAGSRTGRWCRTRRRPFGVGLSERPLQLLLRSRVLEERAVPYLDAVAVLAREPAQEAGQGAEVGRAEGGRQLDPERVDSRPERLDRGQEGAQRLIDIGQAALVGDRLRQLEDEPKVRGGLPGPRRHRVAGRGRVKGGVALHGVAPGRVGAEPLTRRQRGRQPATLPGCVRPHRAADVEFHGPEGTERAPRKSGAFRRRCRYRDVHGRDVHEGVRASVPDDGRPGARTGAGAPAWPRIRRRPAP